ncbi:hypothetical protein [Bacillus sp. NTK034]|uniref:hypothetical protein n=1 Tax=Bacillus sp. NTK034 TaxID=2802176 RepID=UPI001A909471|nr:hypothetical protein [Bacillus sp. NTK034]MBN8203480.1 hypothetical protein [Bacillus sp. NTK034]
MSQNIEGSQEKELSLIEEAFELLQNADIEISLDDVKNLLQFSPHVKELFVKATGLSHNSGQNVFDVIKKVIFIYEEELKRDDLTLEQRTAIYDRMDKHAMNAMQQDDSNKKFIGGAIGAVIVALVGGAVKFGPNIVKAMVKK